MTLSSPSIEAQVATSPRHYASAFRSQEQRFKGLPAEKIQVTNLEYDIDLFDTTAGVQRSHRNFAATFRPPTKSEEIDSNWKIPKVTDPSYNVDCGTKTGVFNGIQVREGFHGPGRKYGFNLKAPRFTSQRKCGPETEVYDVDALNKSTLVTTCQKSPLRYSGMTAVTPRSEVQSKAACADYNPDVFNIARRVKESGFKVSTMTSLTPRPATERVVNGGEYDTDALNKTTCFKNSLLLPGARSSFVATPRRPPGVRTDGADKMYDADYGPAQSVWTKVRTSPRIYANMRYSSRRDEERPPLGLQLEYQADCPAQPSVATEVLCTPRLYTNVRTHTPRFVDLVLPPQLGAIYDHESAPRGEGSIAKRVSESQRKYFGVQVPLWRRVCVRVCVCARARVVVFPSFHDPLCVRVPSKVCTIP
mmetsp:Transcript_12908/g.35792  ORF Transcript_12908/g.35792 Transcript_12908/m.35792 type:complete len:419 (-) Transcript_12908:459-1715(-)